MVGVVGQGVESHIRDHFDDETVVDAAVTRFVDVGIGQYTALVDDLDREPGKGAGHRIVGTTVTRFANRPCIEARALAEQRMRRQAVLAAIGLADGKRQGFALGCGQAAAGQGFGEGKVTVEYGRGVGESREQVRHNADLGLDAIQSGSDGTGCIVTVDRLNTSHDESPLSGWL